MKQNRHNYENLEIYKRSLAIAVDVKSFVDVIRPYRLAEHISGSSVSIPSNISEGSERGTNKEFRRFLEYSSGSCSELTTQLNILKLANKLPEIDLNRLIKETKEINAMIRGFMNRLRDE